MKKILDLWWFYVADVVEVLTETTDVRQYIKKLRNRDTELSAKFGIPKYQTFELPSTNSVDITHWNHYESNFYEAKTVHPKGVIIELIQV